MVAVAACVPAAAASAAAAAVLLLLAVDTGRSSTRLQRAAQACTCRQVKEGKMGKIEREEEARKEDW